MRGVSERKNELGRKGGNEFIREEGITLIKGRAGTLAEKILLIPTTGCNEYCNGNAVMIIGIVMLQ